MLTPDRDKNSSPLRLPVAALRSTTLNFQIEKLTEIVLSGRDKNWKQFVRILAIAEKLSESESLAPVCPTKNITLLRGCAKEPSIPDTLLRRVCKLLNKIDSGFPDYTVALRDAMREVLAKNFFTLLEEGVRLPPPAAISSHSFLVELAILMKHTRLLEFGSETHARFFEKVSKGESGWSSDDLKAFINDNNFLYHYIVNFAPKTLLQLVIHLGANPNANEPEASRCLRLLHVAALERNLPAVEALVEGGADSWGLDSYARPALHYLGESSNFRDSTTIAAAIEIAKILIPKATDTTLRAISCSNLYSMLDRRFPTKFTLFVEDQVAAYPSKYTTLKWQAASSEARKEALAEIRQIYSESPPLSRDASIALQTLNLNGDPFKVLRIFRVKLDVRDGKSEGKGFSEALPELLHEWSDSSLATLVRNISHNRNFALSRISADTDPPYTPEILALLSHPAILESYSYLGHEIDIWLKHSNRESTRDISKLCYSNLTRIGIATFSFHWWQAITSRGGMPGRATLVEECGLVKCPPRPTDSADPSAGPKHNGYGPGYLLPAGKLSFDYYLWRSRSPEVNIRDRYSRDSKTSNEIRQGYYRIYNPKHGCLVIRQSSWESDYGRKALPNTAVWSPATFTESELLALDMRALKCGFVSVTSPVLKDKDHESIRFLLNEHEGVWQFVSTRLCDLRAETYIGVLNQEVGGRRSELFHSLIDFLVDSWKAGRRSYELVLLASEYGPFAELMSLPVDEKMIDGLIKLRAYKLHDREYGDLGLADFIQNGLNDAGDFMLRYSRGAKV